MTSKECEMWPAFFPLNPWGLGKWGCVLYL